MICLAQIPLDGPWSVIVPALMIAAVGGMLVLLGWGLGRRVRERGPRRDVLAALEQLAEGDFSISLRASAEDPDAPLVERLLRLAEALSRRERDPGRRRMVRLAEALDSLDDRALLVADPDLTVTAASSGAGRLLGREGRLEGCGLDELFDAEALAGFVSRLARARRDGGRATTRLPASSGSEMILAARWLEGESPGVLMWFEPAPPPAVDPERIAARLRAVIDGLGTGIAIVENGVVVETNPASRALLGEEAEGRRLGDLVAAEDLLLVLDRVGRAARGETVAPFRCRVGEQGGERLIAVEVEAIGVPSKEGEGAVAVALRPAGAVTGEQAVIRTREARLLGVLDALPDGVALLVDREGAAAARRVALVNSAFERLAGIDSSEVLGAPEDEFVALVGARLANPDRFAEFLEAAAEAPDEEREARFEFGPERGGAVIVAVAPVRGPAGRSLGRLVAFRPVSGKADPKELARTETSGEDLAGAYDELQAVHRDLAARTEELARLNRELEELDRFRARLLGEAAHELQSPLVSVRGYTQMLLDGRLGRLNDEQRRGLEATLRNVDRMSELIGNLLALARAEKNDAPEPDAVDAGSAVEDVVMRHEGAARERGVRLEARVDEPGAQVAAEPEDLRRVLDNLVANAVKFTPRGGRATVGLAPGPRGYVDLVVEDTGIGIPEDERDKVFETFFRGRGAKDAPGTGLGLAMVRRIVARYGAEIRVESRVGHGTRFTVRWPRARRNDDAQTANRRPGASSA